MKPYNTINVRPEAFERFMQICRDQKRKAADQFEIILEEWKNWDSATQTILWQHFASTMMAGVKPANTNFVSDAQKSIALQTLYERNHYNEPFDF